MKNMFNRVKNNMEYAKWRKIRVESEKEMKKHLFDDDTTEYKYWAARYSLALKKCIELDID